MNEEFKKTQQLLNNVNLKKGTPSDLPDNSIIFVDVKQFRSFVEKHDASPAEPNDTLAEQAVCQAMKYHYGQREPVVKVRDGVYATHFSKIKSGNDIGTESGYFVESLGV